MFYGATVTVKVISTQHRRSLLVQGGLAIPVMVKVAMEYSTENKEALSNTTIWSAQATKNL